MKKLLFVVLIAAVYSIALSGCKEGIDKVLVGTWNVTEVQGVFNSGSNSALPIIDGNPTGTITFRSNGTGEQNYSYTLGGTQYPQTGSFSWSATNDLIIIERVNDPDMEWTRVIDQDNKQVATYNYLINANQSWDYTLTLEK
jgi:hypothetical protein